MAWPIVRSPHGFPITEDDRVPVVLEDEVDVLGVGDPSFVVALHWLGANLVGPDSIVTGVFDFEIARVYEREELCASDIVSIGKVPVLCLVALGVPDG